MYLSVFTIIRYTASLASRSSAIRSWRSSRASLISTSLMVIFLRDMSQVIEAISEELKKWILRSSGADLPAAETDDMVSSSSSGSSSPSSPPSSPSPPPSLPSSIGSSSSLLELALGAARGVARFLGFVAIASRSVATARVSAAMPLSSPPRRPASRRAVSSRARFCSRIASISCRRASW